LVKEKVHRGEPAFKKPTSKQTKLFQAKMFIQWYNIINSRVQKVMDQDQQKRRCANTGIV